MRPFAKTATFQLLVSLGLLFLNSCSKPDNPSLFDLNDPGRPQPAITSVTPAGSILAGMDTVVVEGTNFSSVVAENSVFFNAQTATLLTATSTQITLIPPIVISDSVAVRAAVNGAYLFSNTVLCKVKAGVATFGGLSSTEQSTALATDTSGNLYAGRSKNLFDIGVLKFTAAGSRSSYAPATGGVVAWKSLKMGPGGYLYAGRGIRAVYRFSQGGGASADLWLAFPLGTLITDIDFDQSGALWGGGNNTSIYRILADKSVTEFPFVGQVYSLRVYNGFLYFAARTDAGQKIWRAQISSGGLGTPEIYFDFGAAYPTNIPLAITFSSDGVLYIGTDSPDGLVVVEPSKSYSVPYKTYKASFGTGLGIFAWGSADDLYCSTSDGALLKFMIRGKKSAPYYGSTL